MRKKRAPTKTFLMKHLFIFFFCFTSTLFATDPRVLGLGAPCLDYVINVEEHELAHYGLKKGGWHEVDVKTLASIIDNGKSPLIFSGSCVANTIKGLASLGYPCTLTGNIGTDSMGDKVQKIFHQAGVKTLFTQTTTPTSQIACLITPDGERSFCAFVSAEHEISENDLRSEYFEGVELVHLSGFRLPNGAYTEKGLRMAKEKGALVSFDLANVGLIEAYRERLMAIFPDYVDVIFANEDEAYAFTQLPPKKAASFLKNFCKVAIVKVGKEGCWVCSKEGLFHSPGIPTQMVDSTGAGDLFASAFLYAYLKGEPLSFCAYLGNMAGSAAVERYGAELSPERWNEILSAYEKSQYR